MPENSQSLPLHVACKHGQTNEVVELLIRMYPRAAKKLSRDGYLPLH
jgi:hypothetical protein